MAELKRHLGMWGAASIGIGAIIGAGIFVLSGVASGFAGPAVILSFLIAGIVALLTALSSAELSSFITEAGGSYIYTHKAFGKFWGFVVGWMQSFDYIVGASAISVGFAGYFVYFAGISPTAQNVTIIVAVIMPLVLTLINLRGIREASGTNNMLVLIKVTALDRFNFQLWDIDDIFLHQYEPAAVEKKNARGKSYLQSAVLSNYTNTWCDQLLCTYFLPEAKCNYCC